MAATSCDLKALICWRWRSPAASSIVSSSDFEWRSLTLQNVLSIVCKLRLNIFSISLSSHVKPGFRSNLVSSLGCRAATLAAKVALATIISAAATTSLQKLVLRGDWSVPNCSSHKTTSLQKLILRGDWSDAVGISVCSCSCRVSSQESHVKDQHVPCEPCVFMIFSTGEAGGRGLRDARVMSPYECD